MANAWTGPGAEDCASAFVRCDPKAVRDSTAWLQVNDANIVASRQSRTTRAKRVLVTLAAPMVLFEAIGRIVDLVVEPSLLDRSRRAVSRAGAPAIAAPCAGIICRCIDCVPVAVALLRRRCGASPRH